MSKHYLCVFLFLTSFTYVGFAKDSSYLAVEYYMAPTITGCPSDITQAITNSCTKAVTWTEPTAIDTNLPVTVDKTHSPGDDFPVGTTTVTYTFTNGLSEVSTCSFEITIQYQFFDLPSNQLITVGASCNRTALWVPPSDCGGSVIIGLSTSPTVGLLNGDSFPIGVTEITYAALRGAALDDIQSFTVTVVDPIAPTLENTPTDITVAANINCEAVVTWTEPSVSDNCTAGIVPTSTFSTGDTFPLGTTLVTYSAQDEAGNPASDVSFNVTVEDQTAPDFTNLPSDIIITADAASCQATITWPTVLATDNCTSTVSNIVSTRASGDTFDLGETEVTYTATDDASNETMASFTVTVFDGTAPNLISCPTNITSDATSDCTATVSWSSPTFADSCDSSLEIISTHTSGNVFPIGITTVTVTATDDAGNETTCIFDVTVLDAIAPIFDECPTDITVVADNGCNAVANWSIPIVSDNCTQDIVPTANFSSGDTFPVGVTEVIYTAMDVAGNQVSCSFNVVVIDQSAPVFNDCPSDIEIEADETCSATASWSPPTASDNCDNTVTITESHISGSSFELGTTTITYTATDEAGNSTSCTFNVTVLDSTGPEISNCPSDIELTTDECAAVVTWAEIVAVDNCSNVSLSSNFSSGDTFNLGITTVVYTFTDEVGNESQCSFNVTVTNPNDLIVSNCPDDIIVETGENGTAEVSWDEPSVSSSCTEVTINQSHQSGDTFGVGTTLVTYEFMDEFERVVTCSFNITVSVRDIEFDIPKLLTPNNDGNNDTWMLSGLENFPDNEVVIVDRWGGEIFKASGYDNQRIVWDGSNQNGKIVPTGTYFFYILVKSNSSTEKKQGFIELVR